MMPKTTKAHIRQDHLRKENQVKQPIRNRYVFDKWNLLVSLWGIKREQCDRNWKHCAYRNLLKIWGSSQ